MDGGAEIARKLHRFSVREYHWAARSGVFEQLRVELIRGAIVDTAPIGAPHIWTVGRLTRSLAPVMMDRRANVFVRCSIWLDDYSKPEPDFMLLSPQADQTIHPGPRDTLLLIEVADSSLGFDRTVKGPLYAEANIRGYWIVNLVDRIIEVHRDPGPDGYWQVAAVSSGQITPLALPDFAIAVDDVLPPVA